MKKITKVSAGILFSLIALESPAEVILSDDFSYGSGDRVAVSDGTFLDGYADQTGNGTFSSVSGIGRARFGGDGYAYAAYGNLIAYLSEDITSIVPTPITVSADFTANQQMLDGGSIDNAAVYLSGYPVVPWTDSSIASNFYIGARIAFNASDPGSSTLRLEASSANAPTGLQRNETSAVFGDNYDAADVIRLSVTWDPSTGEISASAYNMTDDEIYSVSAASPLNTSAYGLGDFDTFAFAASGLNSSATTNFTTFDNFSVVSAVPDSISDDFSFGSGDRSTIADGDDLNNVEAQSGDAFWFYRASSSKMVFRSPGVMGAENTQGNGGAYIPYDFDQVAASNTVVMKASFVAGDQMLNGGTVNGFHLSICGDETELSSESTDMDQITLRFAPNQTTPSSSSLQLYCNVVVSNGVERKVTSDSFSGYSFSDRMDLRLEWSIDSGEVTATASNTVTGFSQTLSLSVPLNPDYFSRSLFSFLTVQATGLDSSGTYADLLIDDFSVDFLSPEPVLCRIVDLVAVSADQLKLLISLPNDPSQYSLVGRDSLTDGDWVPVAHSDDGLNAYLATNLSYSAAEGTNVAVYVSATNSVGFYGIE